MTRACLDETFLSTCCNTASLMIPPPDPASVTNPLQALGVQPLCHIFSDCENGGSLQLDTTAEREIPPLFDPCSRNV